MNYEELLNDWIRNMDKDAQRDTCAQFGLIEYEAKTDTTNITNLVHSCIVNGNNIVQLEKLIIEMQNKKGFLFTDNFCKGVLKKGLSMFNLLIAFRSELS